MKFVTISSGVGVLVEDVDLRNLTDAEQAELDAAWAEHGLVFLRNQELTPEEHLAFATRFAPVDVNKFFAPVDGHPEVAQVLKEPDQRVNIGGGWHTDHSYDSAPARGSVLLARETPPTGGDTLFANAAAAFDALSPGMQQSLEGMRAVHSNAHVFSAEARKAMGMEDRLRNADAVSGTVHPVVIKHPQTGRKLLYVNPGFTRHFEGWTEAESEPLLRQLYQHISSPPFTTRFSWEPGSIAMWDNRSTWHWAVNDYPGHRRLMHRVTIQGEPLEAAAA